MATMVGQRRTPQPASRASRSARRLSSTTAASTPTTAAATPQPPSSMTSTPIPAPRVARSMPLAHMGFEGCRHLEPERLPSGRKERARTVRVIDLNQDTIESIKQIAEGLKRLDLSSLKLEQLNEDLLECLVGLERLDVGFNNLTDEGIPAVFGKLENLVEFSAHYNKLTTVPKVLRKLKNVSRLKLGHNNIETIDGVERLKKLQVLVIENNQIETVPREIYQNIKRLEMWHFSNNQLKEVHSDIRLLRYLRDLDVSGNNLSTLPPELFLLPRLEVLNASSNQISRLPTVNIKGNNRQHLAQVDLSDNSLIKFPEHLLLIAEKLDLSKNKIKVIPSNVIKKLEWGTDQQLNVGDNPLTNPPLEVCECGLRSIMQFFQEAKTDMKVYQGLKVLVLGAPGSGKTSLVQTLVDQQSRLTTAEEVTSGLDMYDLTIEVEDSTPDASNAPEEPPPPVLAKEEPPVVKKPLKKKSKSGLKKKDRASVDSEESSRTSSRVSRKKSPEKKAQIEEVVEPVVPKEGEENQEPKEPEVPEKKTLQLALWDFSGNSQYLHCHYFFLQQPSLVWLVFDISTYEEDNFAETIGCWMDWIIAKTNHLVALVIGTHADKVRPKKAKAICASVQEKVTQYLQSHKDAIEREIKKIENRPHISPALSEQLKKYIGLLKVETIIHPEVLAVSSKELTDVETLQEATKSMALNKEVYPNVLKVIPSLWANVEYYIEDKGYALQVPILTYEEYSEEISKKFGMKHLIEQITHYMHDTGKVLWFSDHPTLCDYVFLRPSWLGDLLKSLFRHDWNEADYTLEEAFKASNMNPHKIEKLRKELTEEGVADKDILKCLWSHLIPTELNKPILEVIAILLDHFELGYPLARSGARDTTRAGGHVERSDSSSTARSSRPVTHDNNRNDSQTRSERTESQATTSVGKKNEKAEPAKVTRLLIPWLRTTKQPKLFREEYEQFAKNPHLAAVFRFPRYTPPGLFETLTVRALKPSHDLTSLHHWSGGLYARYVAQTLRFYLLRIPHDDNSTCIRIEVRSEQSLEVVSQGTGEDGEEMEEEEEGGEAKREAEEKEKVAEMLWGLLLPYLRDVEDLIGKYAGARVERHMECPECNAMSFLGEWLTPKELQNMSSKPCDSCQAEIPTVMLVQPKEKKKVEEFLLQKLMKQAEARAEAEKMADGQVTKEGDDGIATGSDVIQNGGPAKTPPENGPQTEGKGSAKPRDEKKGNRKKSSIVTPEENGVGDSAANGVKPNKQVLEKTAAEKGKKNQDEVFDDDANVGENGDQRERKKSNGQKKRKRESISQPEQNGK